MSQADAYRRKAEALLRQAANVADMADRGRYIDEALHWHNLAMDAAGHPDQRVHTTTRTTPRTTPRAPERCRAARSNP